MALPSKTCTCDCGNVLDVPVITHLNGQELNKPEYDVCNIECPLCGRRSDGGNYGDGTVAGWITRRDADASQAEYERQCFSADMNEMYGRGNHCF